MTSRFYCGDTSLQEGQQLELPKEESRHFLKTLRGKVGDTLVVFGGGSQYRATVTGVADGRTQVQLLSPEPFPAPPSVRVTCLIPWIKGGKTDFLVQKLTELGAAGIGIFNATRDVAKGDDTKLDRLTRIALEACKQCERVDVPSLFTATSLAAALEKTGCSSANPAQVLHERAGQALLSSVFSEMKSDPSDIVLASGPEGGWDPRDLDPVPQSAMRYISLGPRILRAETAPIAALSAILALSGDI